MSNNPYINIHTHFPLENRHTNCLSILNISQKDNFYQNDIAHQYYSIGLHPWYLTKENFREDFEKLVQHISHKKVIIIGECGLDALHGENLSFQSETFAAQIELAASIQKPVIIHCVKAYDGLIAIKKKLKPSVPLIVHGFNQNETILKQLLKNDFYISIGSALLRGGSNAENAVKNMPIDRLFLENDDKNVSIDVIYKKACLLLGLEIEELRRQIGDNFNEILTPHTIL